LPTIIIARKAKFQLEASENKIVIFSPPSKFTELPKAIHGHPWGPLSLGLERMV